MAKNILVVDDSKTVRSALTKIVQGFGFSSFEAGNGQEALNACHSQMPEGVLLDWNMPVMDGMQFLKKLRSLPGGKSPKVIFCSTENDLKFMKEAILAGAQDYIIKPFDEGVLRTKFQKVGLL